MVAHSRSSTKTIRRVKLEPKASKGLETREKFQTFMLERVQYYTAAKFLGRGKYHKLEAPTMEEVKQLASSKEQILGQIAMAEENNIGFMIMMARTLLDLGRITSLDEIFERVKKTSAHDLQLLANEMFDEDKMSQLIMHP